MLAGLHERDARSVFLEGGPTLAGSFVAAGLIDRAIAYIAPALLGAGRPGLVDAGITSGPVDPRTMPIVRRAHDAVEAILIPTNLDPAKGQP